MHSDSSALDLPQWLIFQMTWQLCSLFERGKSLPGYTFCKKKKKDIKIQVDGSVQSLW